MPIPKYSNLKLLKCKWINGTVFSSEGCSSLIAGSYLICSCNHLTKFILMEEFDPY